MICTRLHLHVRSVKMLRLKTAGFRRFLCQKQPVSRSWSFMASKNDFIKISWTVIVHCSGNSYIPYDTLLSAHVYFASLMPCIIRMEIMTMYKIFEHVTFTRTHGNRSGRRLATGLWWGGVDRY